jgi:hypothetical protein
MLAVRRVCRSNLENAIHPIHELTNINHAIEPQPFGQSIADTFLSTNARTDA